jgi:hypothetical protein
MSDNEPLIEYFEIEEKGNQYINYFDGPTFLEEKESEVDLQLPDRNIVENASLQQTLRKKRKRTGSTTLKPHQQTLTRQESETLQELLRFQKWVDVINMDKTIYGSSSNLLNIDLNDLKEDDDLGVFKLWGRRHKASAKIAILNLDAAFLNLATNGWTWEYLGILCVVLTSFLAFSLAPTVQSPHLASQLDFQVSFIH